MTSMATTDSVSSDVNNPHNGCHRKGSSISHVHFPEDQLPEHDSNIVLRYEGDGQIAVHLGFLQIRHHYQISFSIKDDLHQDLKHEPLQNLHIKVIEVRPAEDGQGHDLVIEMTAHKEKLLKEKLILFDSTNPEKTIKLVFHARVLGKGKGTPSLREGIHCTGIDVDDDSEHSDWQGF